MIQQKHLASNGKSKNLTNSVKFHKFNNHETNINTDLSKSSLTHVASETHFIRNNSPIKKTIVNGFQPHKHSSFISIENQSLLNRNKKQPNSQSKDYILQQFNDSYSIGGHSKNTLQADQYYKYWKSKAHEYLDQNFKLREQNKKIKQQNEQLRNKKSMQLIQITSKQTENSLKLQKTQTVEHPMIKQRSFDHLQKLFKDKMDQLQKQIASKDIVISQLQNKVIELNKKILGQQQRAKLQIRLGEQVQSLSNQNIVLKNKLFCLGTTKQVIHSDNKIKLPHKNQNTYNDIRKKYSQNNKIN